MEGSVKKRIPDRRVSQIPEDIVAVAASFGPSPKQMYYRHTVRGVSVQWLELTDGRYRACVFPNGSVQWVNEQNIRSVKISTHSTGEVHAPAQQAA